MNRQDAKDAKEIENLEKFVIGASIGYELHASNGLTGACPKRHPQKLGPESYTYTAKRYTFTYTMMRRVRVGVRVRVGRVSDPSDSWSKSRIPVLDGALPSCSAQTSMPSVASTATVPGFSCPNPITRPFETDKDPDPVLASPLTFSDDLWQAIVGQNPFKPMIFSSPRPSERTRISTSNNPITP